MLGTGLSGCYYYNNNPYAVLVLREFKFNGDQRPVNNQYQQN